MEDSNQSNDQQGQENAPVPSSGGNQNLESSEEPSSGAAANSQNAPQSTSNPSNPEQQAMDEHAEELRQLQSMLESRFPQNLFQVFGPRMQQIIRTSMMPMPNSSHSRLIEQLGHVGIGALPALTDLCQMLCMGTEDNLVGFNYRAAVPLLITHLKDNEVEVSQHAARALTYLLESLPRSLQAVSEAIPALLERVACIHDDGLLGVAEQSLSCLEKLSARHGRQILLERGCSQVVLFLDFFSIVAQRHALNIVLSCMRALEYCGTEFHLVEDALPAIVSRLQHSDRRSMELSIQAICKLVDRRHTMNSEVMEKLRRSNIAENLIKVVCDPQNLSANLATICLRSLTYMAEACPQTQVEICESSIPSALQGILTVDIAASPQREAQELVEAIRLATALLPKGTEKRVEHPIELDLDTDFLDDDYDESEASERAPSPAAEVSENDMKMCAGLIKSLYPLCWKLLNAAPNTSVRVSVIQIVIRMSYSTTADVLRELLASQESETCSQIQQLLDSSDTRILVPALQLTRTVLSILPEFQSKFQREGLVHCLTQLQTRKLRVHSTSVSGPLSAPASLATTPSDQNRPLRFAGSQSETKRVKSRKSGSYLTSLMPSRKLYPDAEKIDATEKTVKEQLNDAIANVEKEIKVQQALESLESPTNPLPIPTLPTDVKRKEQEPEAPPAAPSSESAEGSSTATSATTLSANSMLQIPTSSGKTETQSHYRNRCDSQSRKEIELNWARQESKEILEEFFKDQENEEGQSALITQLIEVNEMLKQGDLSKQIQGLEQFASILTAQDLSPFEIIHTKIMESLFEYLQASSLNQKEFLRVFASLPKESELNTTDVVIPQNTELLEKLVAKIHQIVSHVEKFPVKLFDIQHGRSMTGGSQHSQKKVKCVLQKDPSCPKTKQWTSGPVKIDPLAPVSAIERHLVMKGFGFSVTEVRNSDSEENDSESDDESDQPSFIAFARGQRLLDLFINGQKLAPNITIYQAIRECEESGSELSDDEEYQNMIWGRTFTITYKLIPKESMDQDSKKKSSQKFTRSSTFHPIRPSGPTDLTGKQNDEATLFSAIGLLRGLFGLSRFWQTLFSPSNSCSKKMLIEPEEFENHSITSKVWRQLQDPLNVLSGTLPSWLSDLIENSSFLLPFDLRRYLFYITAFDRQRALAKFVERNPDHDMSSSRRLNSERSSREKKIVDRSRILQDAEELLNKTKNSNAYIEVQYSDEVGTGLGPTLEFYTLVSKEIQRTDLGLWRGHRQIEDNLKGKSQVIDSTTRGEGLFPNPIAKSCKKSTVTHITNKFKFFGQLLGRALKDSRLLDLPLSPLLCRYLLSEEETLKFRDLYELDAQLARSLQQLQTFSSNGEVDSIDELYLDFVLPGFNKFELMKSGASKAVNGDNLSKYIDLVTHWTMLEGVRRQFQAIKIGFSEVCDIKHLKIFHPWELPRIFCGSERARWTVLELETAIRFDHGYSTNCRAVQFFNTVLSELTGDEQADFLRFSTGSPHLPVGGLKSLNPPLTVVKKTVEEGENPEDNLPSVMTCQNYLKLPDYPTLQLMREKLLLAISEGQGAFLLS
ncbi:Oidioi.mRNA.OKI2018_I69.chr1.g1498.t1.cds [Oikopleura dioica]|uniref:E3 ubiquitin-protein ligase n=1 Tax=Oikopleura dioica TaxID=34765 RepID=A0ABN7SUF8_OIKDI|nr:Oidioi.mRNA.OKI2018_I69.chr1.g1498.t1.cds [Oikopleura dioica]